VKAMKKRTLVSEAGKTIGQVGVYRLEQEAERPGHRGRTKGSIAGAALGAAVLSFVGVWPAALAAGVCCLIGGAVGDHLDKHG
jgi:hypothetical protein